MAKLSDRDEAPPHVGEQEIIDTAVMTLLTTSEERREAMMELLTMTFAREMRQHWPDMPGKEIFTRTSRLVRDVRKRIADIRAVGGAYVGTA
jgi:hypothetical protein